MPWESIANREYSEKSDVWAYGCTLYEIVKREEPYQDQNLMDVAVRIRDEGLTPMKSLPPDAPEYIVALMELCFSHNPNDRPTFKQIGGSQSV
jgi:serine/threonine protein kinase